MLSLKSSLAIVIGLAIMVAAAPTLAQTGDNARRTISISASGSVAAVPDAATISAGVVTEATTARAALDQNSAAMQKLIDGLKAMDIAARDIRTRQFNVQPRYERSRTSAPKIDGYQVTNSVSVLVRDVAKVGDVLDRAATLGANQMGGVSFTVTKEETLRNDARKAAFANARDRANLYAEAAGVRLGAVISIAESVHGPSPRGGAMTRQASAPVPIEAGEQDITVSVDVVWALE